MANDPPDDFATSAVAFQLKRLTEIESNSISAIPIIGEATLLYAQWLADHGSLEKAELAYRGLLDRLNELGLPLHHLSLRATLQLAKLADQQNIESQQRHWRTVFADALEQSGEFGTVSNCEWCIDLMRTAEDPEAVHEINSSIKPWSAVFSDAPFIKRWFLRLTAEASAKQSDWQLVKSLSAELFDLEIKLWDDSFPNAAYARALAGLAEHHLAKTNSQDNPVLVDARKLAQKSLTENQSNLASVFLYVVADPDIGMPRADEYQWIHHYMMHYSNPPETQLEMAIFYLQGAHQNNAVAAKRITQFLFDRKDIYESKTGGKAMDCLQFLKLTNGMVDSRERLDLLKTYVNSPDKDVSNFANQILSE